MKTKGQCWGCGQPIAKGHYHDTAPAGAVLSSTCRELNTAAQARQRHAVKRTQAAAVNGGVELGRHNKDLATRLSKLTVRSHAEVGKLMGLSAEGVRLIELRCFAKIRAALLPFKNTQTGAEKVRVVTCPIPSL